MEAIGHLPVAVRRALNEKSLRRERDRAEKELRRIEAHYRALAGNLSYGICRCSHNGSFLDVNQALLSMLGYSSAIFFLTLLNALRFLANGTKALSILSKRNGCARTALP